MQKISMFSAAFLVLAGCSPSENDSESSADAAEEPAAEFVASDHRPVFSPDGEKIVFMSDRFNQDWEMFLINSDVTNLVRLTEHAGWDGYAAFTPDGKLFTYDREEGEFKIPYVYNLETSETRPFIEMAGVWATVNDWHPDGSKVVMFIERDKKRDLYYADANGENLEQITETTDLNEHDAHFSPDGTKLAFAVVMESGSALDIMDLESGEIARLVTSTQYLYGLDWSPDGTKIAYTDTPNDNPDGNAEIYLFDLANGVSRQLTTNEDYDHMPVWLPDGSGIMFSSYRSGTEKIYILDLESGEVKDFPTG